MEKWVPQGTILEGDSTKKKLKIGTRKANKGQELGKTDVCE